MIGAEMYDPKTVTDAIHKVSEKHRDAARLLKMNSKDRGSKILVIEREYTDLRDIANILDTCGYRIEIARSGIEAMDIMSTNQIGLVIVDLLAPEGRGLEYMNAVSLFPHIPVITVTERAKEDPAIKKLRQNKFIVLRKPVDEKQLRKEIMVEFGPPTENEQCHS